MIESAALPCHPRKDPQSIPPHVQQAMEDNWKNWSLVDTPRHERMYKAYMEHGNLVTENARLKTALNPRQLTWKERMTGKLRAAS